MDEVMNNMKSEYGKLYPSIKSGVADSCANSTFSQCQSQVWSLSTDGKHFYHDELIKYEVPLEKADMIYTTIAGVHSPTYKNDTNRSLECILLNNTESGFTIRMQSRKEVYLTGQSARCSWMRINTHDAVNATSPVASQHTPSPGICNDTLAISDCLPRMLDKLSSTKQSVDAAWSSYVHHYTYPKPSVDT